MKTLTLSKPLNPSRCKPRQRITRAEIVESMTASSVIQPVKDIDQGEHGGTPKKTATINQIKYWLKKKYSPIDKCIPLALGSHKTILSDRDDLWGYHRTVAAIRQLTRRRKYMQALAKDGSRRVNLDGSDAGSVSDEHRERAQKMLDQRTKKNRHGKCRNSDESCDRDSGKSTKPKRFNR